VLLAVAAASLLLLTVPPPSDAGRSHALGRLRAADRNLATKTRSAVLDLYSLDARLGAARSARALLDYRVQRLESERRSIGRQLRLATLDSRLSENRVAIRLRYIYDYGSGANSLDVLLGSDSLEQALTRLDDVDQVTAANQSVIVQLRSAQNRLSSLARSLAAGERRLAQTARALTETVALLRQAQAQRSSYLARLEREKAYDAGRILRLAAQAQAAEERSLELARRPPSTPNPVPSSRLFVAQRSSAPLELPRPAGTPLQSPSIAMDATAQGGLAGQNTTFEAAGGRRPLTVVATGYTLPGTTSTGLPVGYGVAAVDPSVIPLGTHMTIPGYGEAVAADTGGSIVGTRIDLWFPTSAAAYSWGKRTLTIILGS
jgi:cystine transport system substrate-binding protein